MITDRQKSLPNDPSMGCLVSIFTIGINSTSFPRPVHAVQEEHFEPNTVLWALHTIQLSS